MENGLLRNDCLFRIYIWRSMEEKHHLFTSILIFLSQNRSVPKRIALLNVCAYTGARTPFITAPNPSVFMIFTQQLSFGLILVQKEDITCGKSIKSIFQLQ